MAHRQEEELPYRPVLDWPTSIFTDAVLDHLRDSASPETCDLLYRNRIPKDAQFRIVKPVTLDQKKRLEGDRAPCPMCSTNKFLVGYLVYLPEMFCCAVIGHCCADKEMRDQAQREYRARTKKNFEEDLLLESLPVLFAKGRVLAQLRPAAEEAQRLYRKFRREVPTVHKHLRDLKHYRGGHLTVSEALKDESFGPRGLGQRGDELTREIEIGVMGGATAVTKDFTPVKDLDFIVRALQSLGDTPDEEKIIAFIAAMEAKHRRAAVAIIERIDRDYHKLVAKLDDFATFFGQDNIELIGRYGTHPLNHFPIEAKYEIVANRPRISFRHGKELSLLLVHPNLHETGFNWPEAKVKEERG